MKIKKLGISMSDRILSLALAGTLVGSVNAMVANGEMVKTSSSTRASYASELVLGHYYDEDVKKNKNLLMDSVSDDNNKEKIFSKTKRNLVPKRIDK